MIKTAVVGASGYIGQHLFNKYRQYYPDCIGTTFTKPRANLVFFDLRNPNSECLRLAETQHEAVVIASAKPNIGWCEANTKEAYALNVLGTLKLVEQLAKHAIHIIFFSSDYVFNGEEGQYTEQAETNANTEYGKQKAEVEREIPNLSNNYTILRLSKIYGTTYQDNTLLDNLAAELIKGKTISVASDQFFSPTFVDDVVQMTLFTQEQKIRGLRNLCYSVPYSRYQIALSLAEKLNVAPNLINKICLHSLPGMEKRPLNTSLLCSTLFHSLQSSLLPMEQAIQRTVANWQNKN